LRSGTNFCYEKIVFVAARSEHFVMLANAVLIGPHCQGVTDGRTDGQKILYDR